MAEAPKKGVLDYLDNLVDDEGLKTDVEVTLTDRTLMNLALTIVASVAASSVAYFLIRKILY